MWSVGCILAEMLTVVEFGKYKGPIFPGKSCYPLSPMEIRAPNLIDDDDQLAHICRFLGPQDASFITNEK